MLRVVFNNVAIGESLDLADISQNGSGVEAIAGLTGFGLPPVQVQWFEGAGHGAKARGYRIEPRDLDIPLYVYEENRGALAATLAKLSRVVAGPFLIELYEDGMLYRYTEVYRVGGGTYTYGEDTTGEHDWQSLITVRAGNPYWLWGHVVNRIPNFIANPDFETDSHHGGKPANWFDDLATGSSSVSSDTDVFASGSQSARFDLGTGTDSTVLLLSDAFPVTPGGTLPIEVFAMGDDSGTTSLGFSLYVAEEGFPEPFQPGTEEITADEVALPDGTAAGFRRFVLSFPIPDGMTVAMLGLRGSKSDSPARNLWVDSVSARPGAVDEFTITNEGTAECYPVWRFTGPLSSITVTDVTAGRPERSFQWSGVLNYGDVLTIDCENALCFDQTVPGNRYNGLAPAPDFFPLQPGDNDVQVYIESNEALTRTNYVFNPTFGSPTTHGWTEGGPNDTAVVDGQLVVGTVDSVSQNAYVPTTATKTIDSLPDTGDIPYMVRLSLVNPPTFRSFLAIPHTITISNGEEFFVQPWIGGSGEFVYFFRRTDAAEVTITVTDGWDQRYTVPLIIDKVYVGEPGPYFDGSSVGTADITYAWTGTPHASTSTATVGDSISFAEVEFRARDWLVI